MAGPWEDYAPQSERAPWEDYAPAKTAASENVPGQISFGGIKPSLIGMIKGAYEAVKSGATLPGDVYAGKVKPGSQEEIERSANLASMLTLGGRAATAPMASAAPAAAELKAAASPTYQSLTQQGNKIATQGAPIAQGIAADLHPQALRPGNSPRTYNELNNLSRAKDLNDVAIARDNMRDIANGISENRLIRVTGEDSTAARQAMSKIDAAIEQNSPGWTKQMAEADANWAAAKRMDKVLKEADKGQKGRLGSFDSNETRAKGFTPEEIDAIKKAHQGGMLGAGLNAIGALNPFHGGITGAMSAAAHLPAAVSTGGLSLAGMPIGMAADAAAKALRQRALQQALDKLASRSPLAQQRLSAGGPAVYGLPQQTSISPLLGLLPLEGRRQFVE